MNWIILQHSEVWVDTSKVWLVKDMGQSDEDEYARLKINGSDIYYDNASSCSSDYGQLLEVLGLVGRGGARGV